MFTATTSVCVTGLVTVVTATHWTLAGKIIILVLIQIGGVGLISLGSIIFISLRKKISLRNRRVIQESYNMDRMGGMVRLVKKVLICVFGAEGIGAVCYAVRFIPQFGLAKGLDTLFLRQYLHSVMLVLICWERTAWLSMLLIRS